MNINQLLVLSLLIFLYTINTSNNLYENLENENTKQKCVERLLNYECLDNEKKEKLNNDCSHHELYLPTGLVKISCEDKILFDTLVCNKMLSEGACDCTYGRKQIDAICNVSPLNIKCPTELQMKDLAIMDKIQELEIKNETCIKKTVNKNISSFSFSNKINIVIFIISLLLFLLIVFSFINKK